MMSLRLCCLRYVSGALFLAHCVLALAAPLSSYAQARDESEIKRPFLVHRLVNRSILELLTVPVTLNSLIAEPISDVLATAYVFPDATIEQRGLRSVSDVVRQIPSADYADARSHLQFGFRGFPGKGTGVQLLIDNLEANDLWENTPYLANQFTLIDVKQVELLIGPASPIYGPDAMNSVINVVTRNSENSPLGTEVLAYLGSYDTREAGVRTVQRLSSTLGMAASYSYFEREGRDFSEFVLDPEYSPVGLERRRELSATHPYTDRDTGINTAVDFIYTPTPSFKLNVGSRFLNSHDGGGMENAELVYDLFTDERSYLHSYLRAIFERDHEAFRLTLHRLGEDAHILFPERDPSAPLRLRAFNIEDSTLYKARAVYDRSFVELGSHVVVGAEHAEREVGEPAIGFVDEDGIRPARGALSDLRPYLGRSNSGVFGSLRQSLFEDTVMLKLGARFDDDNRHNRRRSVHSGVQFTPWTGGSMYLSIAEGFRPPTPFEYYNNQDIGPEQTRNVEVGVEHVMRSDLLLNGVLYHQKGRDLIKETRSGAAEILQNIGEVETIGAVLKAQYHGPSARIDAFYSLVGDEDFAHLTDVAMHKAGVAATISLGSFTVSPALRYGSPVRTEILDTEGTRNLVLPPQWESDLTVIANEVYSMGGTRISLEMTLRDVCDRRNRYANFRGPNPFQFVDQGFSALFGIRFHTRPS
jgi:outer membrane cobalamin receptor